MAFSSHLQYKLAKHFLPVSLNMFHFLQRHVIRNFFQSSGKGREAEVGGTFRALLSSALGMGHIHIFISVHSRKAKKQVTI